MLGKMKIIDNLNLFSTNFFIDILYLILKDGLKWLLVNVAQMNDVVPGLIVIHFWRQGHKSVQNLLLQGVQNRRKIS